MKNLVNKIRNNKILSLIYSIAKAIVTVILLIVLGVIVIQRVTNNELSFGGYRIYTVVTQSMFPEYRVGDILVSKEVKSSDIKIGDDVVYLGEKDDFKDKIVTHRVVSVRKDIETNKLIFTTKGLNNIIEDPEIDEYQLYGKVVYKTVFFSFISRIMTNMVGCFVLFAIATLIISIQIVINIFYDDEDDDDDDDQQSKNDDTKEIETL